MSGIDQGVPLSHLPVLYHEVIQALEPCPGGRYVDCTLGAGGHAKGILEASSPGGQLLGLDVDPQALELAHDQLEAFSDRVILKRASYCTLKDQLEDIGWGSVDGILIDLGLSSMQIDTPFRGFSFKEDAPLDMRFDPDNPLTAADLVNQSSETELAELIYKYGEERYARRIARAIVAARPIDTTLQLAEIVLTVVPKTQKRGSTSRRIHPATRTFQALRIAVNDELGALETVLPQTLESLGHGGRLVVISYHSLEDRLVKQFMRRESRDCICPPQQPICNCGHKAQLVEITRRPVRPSLEEVQRNPRARSARMRVARKI